MSEWKDADTKCREEGIAALKQRRRNGRWANDAARERAARSLAHLERGKMDWYLMPRPAVDK